MIKEYLKNKQPLVYKIIENAFNNNRLSHAYMLVGDDEKLLVDTAYFIAQSVMCDNELLACEKCDTCKRVINNNYADICFIDGKNKSISKEEIIDLKMQFSKTNSEKGNKKVYIINNVENATSSALNSLLTFLEEPRSDAMAILTTIKPDALLDTIKSRCQMIKFKQLDREDCFNKLNDNFDVVSSHLLSNTINNYQSIEKLFEDEVCQHALNTFIKFLEKYLNKDLSYKIYLYNEVFEKNNEITKKSLPYFLNFIITFSKDVLLNNKINDEKYDKLVDKCTNEIALHLLKVSNDILDKNIRGVNFNLLIDQLVFELGGLNV